MTAPSHLKNENNWQMVSSRSGIFLNCVGTIDGKHITIRKCASSGSIHNKYNGFLSATSYWLLSAQDYKFVRCELGGVFASLI